MLEDSGRVEKPKISESHFAIAMEYDAVLVPCDPSCLPLILAKEYFRKQVERGSFDLETLCSSV